MRIHMDVHHYLEMNNEVYAHFKELSRKLDLVFNRLENVMATQAEVKVKLDALTADVAAETTVIASMETLLDNLATLIAQLKEAATNAQIDPAIVDQIDALGTAVGANKERIAADIVKNTPAA